MLGDIKRGLSLFFLVCCASTRFLESRSSDVSNEKWSFIALYLILIDQEAPQRQHDLREAFNALRLLAHAAQ